MKDPARPTVVGLLALVVGYAIGSHAQPSASASPVPHTTQTYITSGAEARELVIWRIEGGKVVAADRFWSGSGTEAPPSPSTAPAK